MGSTDSGQDAPYWIFPLKAEQNEQVNLASDHIADKKNPAAAMVTYDPSAAGSALVASSRTAEAEGSKEPSSSHRPPRSKYPPPLHRPASGRASPPAAPQDGASSAPSSPSDGACGVTDGAAGGGGARRTYEGDGREAAVPDGADGSKAATVAAAAAAPEGGGFSNFQDDTAGNLFLQFGWMAPNEIEETTVTPDDGDGDGAGDDKDAITSMVAGRMEFNLTTRTKKSLSKDASSSSIRSKGSNRTAAGEYAWPGAADPQQQGGGGGGSPNGAGRPADGGKRSRDEAPPPADGRGVGGSGGDMREGGEAKNAAATATAAAAAAAVAESAPIATSKKAKKDASTGAGGNGDGGAKMSKASAIAQAKPGAGAASGVAGKTATNKANIVKKEAVAAGAAAAADDDDDDGGAAPPDAFAVPAPPCQTGSGSNSSTRRHSSTTPSSHHHAGHRRRAENSRSCSRSRERERRRRSRSLSRDDRSKSSQNGDHDRDNDRGGRRRSDSDVNRRERGRSRNQSRSESRGGCGSGCGGRGGGGHGMHGGGSGIGGGGGTGGGGDSGGGAGNGGSGAAGARRGGSDKLPPYVAPAMVPRPAQGFDKARNKLIREEEKAARRKLYKENHYTSDEPRLPPSPAELKEEPEWDGRATVVQLMQHDGRWACCAVPEEGGFKEGGILITEDANVTGEDWSHIDTGTTVEVWACGYLRPPQYAWKAEAATLRPVPTGRDGDETGVFQIRRLLTFRGGRAFEAANDADAVLIPQDANTEDENWRHIKVGDEIQIVHMRPHNGDPFYWIATSASAGEEGEEEEGGGEKETAAPAPAAVATTSGRGYAPAHQPPLPLPLPQQSLPPQPPQPLLPLQSPLPPGSSWMAPSSWSPASSLSPPGSREHAFAPPLPVPSSSLAATLAAASDAAAAASSAAVLAARPGYQFPLQPPLPHFEPALFGDLYPGDPAQPPYVTSLPKGWAAGYPAHYPSQPGEALPLPLAPMSSGFQAPAPAPPVVTAPALPPPPPPPLPPELPPGPPPLPPVILAVAPPAPPLPPAAMPPQQNGGAPGGDGGIGEYTVVYGFLKKPEFSPAELREASRLCGEATRMVVSLKADYAFGSQSQEVCGLAFISISLPHHSICFDVKPANKALSDEQRKECFRWLAGLIADDEKEKIFFDFAEQLRILSVLAIRPRNVTDARELWLACDRMAKEGGKQMDVTTVLNSLPLQTKLEDAAVSLLRAAETAGGEAGKERLTYCAELIKRRTKLLTGQKESNFNYHQRPPGGLSKGLINYAIVETRALWEMMGYLSDVALSRAFCAWGRVRADKMVARNNNHNYNHH